MTVERGDLKDYETSLPPDIMIQLDSVLRVSLSLEERKEPRIW